MIVERRNGAILRQLRTLYNLGTIRDLTDGQLLERFATDRNEVAELAFSALVERHEAMVWRVCRAIVDDEHDAEDAFQATFLVLVHNARSLWVRDSLGPWLHQVAWRTASCMRKTLIRRRKHERHFAERDAAGGVAIEIPRDFDRDAAVHEELNRLPEKYRAPVVLCDLEGRTHQEAARSLGWPIGTVKSRQLQGRGLLRDRLTRRGLGLAVALAAVESLRKTAVAAMPKRVARGTVNAVMHQTARLLTGFGVSTPVISLAQGVLQTMLWIKLRVLAVGALCVAIACVGASLYVCGAQEPALKDRPPVSQRSTKGAKQNPQPVVAKQATEQPAAATLRAQKRAIRKAKAFYEIAKQNRVLAQIAIEEYEETKYRKDLSTVEGEIKLSEADLSRAADRVEWSRRMQKKGYVSLSVRNSEELSLQNAKFALEQANNKLKVLKQYTKDKTIKELKSELEKTRADELAKEAIWTLEKAKEIEMERQFGLKSE